MAALAQALKRGYGGAVARDDDDLGTLRGRSEFQSLVAESETRRK